MKWLLALEFIFLSAFFVKAQDTIVKRDGEKIISKILEVNQDNIKYKRHDFQEGPTYTLGKENINYIVYSNGIKEMYDKYVTPQPVKEIVLPVDLTIQPSGKYYYYKDMRITEPDMHAVVKKLRDPKLNSMIKSVENKKFVQDITLYGSIPIFISGLYLYETNRATTTRRGKPSTSSASRLQAQKNGAILMIAALACDVVSVFFVFDRKRHNHFIVEAYNKSIINR